MTAINTITARALQHLTARQRAGYAGDVLRGAQRWSGADLRGKARKYGAHYARQRAIASRAWWAAGGRLLAIEHGRIVSAVPVGMDDYGDAIYSTRAGTYRAPNSAQTNFRVI